MGHLSSYISDCIYNDLTQKAKTPFHGQELQASASCPVEHFFGGNCYILLLAIPLSSALCSGLGKTNDLLQMTSSSHGSSLPSAYSPARD